MPHKILIVGALLALLAACSDEPTTTTTPDAGPLHAAKIATSMSYPVAKTVVQNDDYHGTSVGDPYRWMEDLDAPDLQTWIQAQNELVEDYLHDAPGRAQIKSRLTALWNTERFGVPEKHGSNYFYSHNNGLQNQSPVYVQEGLEGTPRLLLDPNTLSTDGTIALAEVGVSGDGKSYAYSLSDGGSDWRTIRFRDVTTGTDRNDEIHWAKFTNIAWAHDASGIYYSGYDAPKGEDQLKAINKFQKVYFHQLGTPQTADRLIFERPDQADWGFSAEVSDDGRYLVITSSEGTDERNRVFVQDLSQKHSEVTALIEKLEAAYVFIGNVGDRLYFRTDEAAERSRVIAIDLAHPGKSDWQTVVPQSDANLVSVSLVNQQLIAQTLRDARSEVKVFALDGKLLHAVPLPGLGSTEGFVGASTDRETFFSFGSYATPPVIQRYDLESGEVSLFKSPQVAFDPADYATRQVFYTSKDGTRIPLFITSKLGLANDGNNPTILYGYGGFNIPSTPRYSPAVIGWMELGGVYAVANLRGGGEYGTAWHQAGMKLQKQNVFDDFAAAAEYLIAEKITQPSRLAISGRSNGGLLVGATLLQRPELFAAALPAVGVLDMLRFREFTIGWAWESDYGSVKNADEFKALYAYSPLHNIKTGVNYPATLITTADHDDRVFPAHSFKFAAALQAAYANGKPILIRIESRAGHGAGKPTDKVIEETADIYAFLSKTLKMEL